MLRKLPALVGLALAASPLAAQVGLASSAQTVVLTATKQGSVRVALPGGKAATLPGALGLGPNDFAPVAIETSWDLDPSATAAVALVAYFPAPAAALAGSGTAIPSSAVSARMPSAGQTGFARFTGAALGDGAVGVAGGTLVLFSQPVTGGTAAGTRTDRLEVRVDLTGWTALPPGQYQGTLNLLAITQ